MILTDMAEVCFYIVSVMSLKCVKFNAENAVLNFQTRPLVSGGIYFMCKIDNVIFSLSLASDFVVFYSSVYWFPSRYTPP